MKGIIKWNKTDQPTYSGRDTCVSKCKKRNVPCNRYDFLHGTTGQSPNQHKQFMVLPLPLNLLRVFQRNHFLMLFVFFSSFPPSENMIFELTSILFSPSHPVTWIQRKSHRFGQSAHVDWGKIEQDPAGLVLTLKTWALYSVRCPGRRPSILMSHSHRHRNKKEGGWIYILSRSIKQWIVNNLFHAIKIKIACCLVSWVILCDNERYVMCSN